MPLNAYADIGTVQRRFSSDQALDAADIIEALRMLSTASRNADHETRRKFYPATATKYLRGSGTDRLELAADLLSVSAIGIDDDEDRVYETALVEDTDYELANLDDEDEEASPYSALILLDDAAISYWPTYRRAVRITGRWGYSADVEAVLTSAGAAVTGTLADATDTTLTTSAAAVPVLAAGMRIKLGTEDIEIISGTVSPFVVTRGINGTSAAAQSAVAISKYVPPSDVVDATLIEFARLWKRKDTPIMPVLAAPGFGDMSLMSAAMDPDAKRALSRLKRYSAGR